MLTKKRELGHILIFNDKNRPGMGVAAELYKSAQTENFKIKTVPDPSQLRQMLENDDISAVVIDVGREIGDTLAALRILEGFPAIPLFIFNNFMLPRIEEKAMEYGHYYTENQGEFAEFIAMIVAAAQRKKTAVIQGISLSKFLQLMDIEKWSGRVTVTSGADQGVLLLQDGRLISVAAGELTGQDAWQEMAVWKKIMVETFSGQLPLTITGIQANAAPDLKKRPSHPAAESERAGSGNIEILHLIRQNGKIVLNLKKLNLAVAEIRDILTDSLLRTDIFLADNGRSLAGWNSHPLACSEFAAITKSLKTSLQLSQFPPLGAYYLLDLDANQILFIVLKGELQWGFLLKGTKERLGLLLNIVLPKALAILENAVTTRHVG